MSEQPPHEDNISDEFRNLGKSLLSALQAVWDSPERQRIQNEIVEGLNEAGATLKKEAEEFSISQTGQQIKRNIEQLGNEFRSSEMKENLRKDLVNVLKTTNTELEKVINRFSEKKASTESSESEASGSFKSEVSSEESAPDRP
jgi:hypothetical protein